MQKPVKPYPPYKGHYDAKVVRKYIYSYFTRSERDDRDHDEWDDDPDENDWTKIPPAKPVSEVNLAWLMTQAPEGITLDKIKVELGEDSCCMSFDGYFVRFYYEETEPARKAAYKADMETYNAAVKQYEQDEIAYKEWCRQDEIRKTEAKLAKLKKGSNG